MHLKLHYFDKKENIFLWDACLKKAIKKSRKGNNEHDYWVCSVHCCGSKYRLRFKAETGFSFRSFKRWRSAWSMWDLSFSWSYHWSCSFFAWHIYSKYRWRLYFAGVCATQHVIKPIHCYLHFSEYLYISMQSTTAPTDRNLAVSCVKHFSSWETDFLYSEREA